MGRGAVARLTAALVAALLFLLLVPSSPSARAAWTSVKSANFTTVGALPEKDLRSVALRLEQFREAVHVVWPSAKLNNSVPTVVFVFRDLKEHRPFLPLYHGKPNETIGGYFLAGDDQNTITLRFDGDLDAAYPLVFHEYFHYLVFQNLVHAPPWLNEGLADIFASFTVRPDGKHFDIGSPKAWCLNWLRGGKAYMSVETLLKAGYTSPEYQDPEKNTTLYAKGWALAHYLMLTKDLDLQARFIQFLDSLATKAPTDETYRDLFRVDYKTLESRLAYYVDQTTLFYLEATVRDPLSYASETTGRPLPDSEVAALLGDLELRAGRFDEALPWLTKAHDAAPESVPVRIGLAQVAIAKEQFEEAVAGLAPLVADAPSNIDLLRLYAQALHGAGSRDAAVGAFERAIAVRPDEVDLRVDLGLMFAELGRDADAQAQFDRALQSEAEAGSVFYDRGYIYLRQQRGDLAAQAELRALGAVHWAGPSAQYMALTAHFGYREAGKAQEAADVLDRAVSVFPSREWPFPVLRYLKGQLTGAKMLTQATDIEKKTEAYAYLGLDERLAGRLADARTHLEWVKNNGLTSFYEYSLAIAELNAMNKGK